MKKLLLVMSSALVFLLYNTKTACMEQIGRSHDGAALSELDGQRLAVMDMRSLTNEMRVRVLQEQIDRLRPLLSELGLEANNPLEEMTAEQLQLMVSNDLAIQIVAHFPAGVGHNPIQIQRTMREYAAAFNAGLLTGMLPIWGTYNFYMYARLALRQQRDFLGCAVFTMGHLAGLSALGCAVKVSPILRAKMLTYASGSTWVLLSLLMVSLYSRLMASTAESDSHRAAFFVMDMVGQALLYFLLKGALLIFSNVAMKDIFSMVIASYALYKVAWVLRRHLENPRRIYFP